MNTSEIKKANFNQQNETKIKTNEETNEEKLYLNSTLKSNLKFNSELLNKPFGTLKLNENENKFSNFDNVNNFNESSASGFFRSDNYENNISKISFSGSMNFNKSNDFNSSLLDSKGKRKPFEKLTFNVSASEQNNFFDKSNGFGLNTNYRDAKNKFDYILKKDSKLNIINKNENNLHNLTNLIQNKNKKEILKVENFGKIQNRIKDTINANKKQNAVDYLGTEVNNNSTTLKNKANYSSLKNDLDFNNNSNLINIDSIINNNDKNLNPQRMNTARSLIQDLNNTNNNNSKINLDSSTQNKNLGDKSNLKENSKNYSAYKNKYPINELSNLKSKEGLIKNNNINSSRGENSIKYEKFSKGKKETSNLLESQSEVKCMEETRLTEIDNLLIKNNNHNDNFDQTNLFDINVTNSHIKFQNESLSNKYNNKTNLSNNKNNQNQLINSLSNTKNNINEITEMNESNVNNVSNLNKTAIPKKELSIILKSKTKQKLTKEELEKAKLFNYQFDSKVPFWVKFFLDLEEDPDSIQSNSSYFKVDNKIQYVDDLIQMVKKDAELYEKTQKDKEKKQEGKQIIKSLLLTEVKLTNTNPFSTDKSELSSTGRSMRDASNTIQEESKYASESIEKSVAEADLSLEEREAIDKINDPVNKLLEGVLNKYEKTEKNEARKRVENFSEFKTRLIKRESVKEKYGLKSIDRFNSVVQSAMNRFSYPNLNNIKENLNDDERIFKTIDKLKFPEIFDPFMELDYSQFELGYLDKEDLQRLFEIDKKLHALDQEKYSESINTDLYLMQMEFNEGKHERLKEIEKEYKEKMARIKNKEIKKPSVFDIKQEDNTKPKYKDYLHEMKTKKDLKNDLFEIDNKIRITRNQEISEERKNEIFEDLSLYYAKNPEYYEREMTRKIPEDFNFDLSESSMKEINSDLAKIKADLEEFDKRVSDKDPNKTFEKFEIEKKNEIKQEMLKNYEKAISMLENIHLENQEKMMKVEELEKKIMEDELGQKALGIFLISIF